jgi:hypothetical protein
MPYLEKLSSISINKKVYCILCIKVYFTAPQNKEGNMQQSSEQQITNNDRRNFLKLAGIAAAEV